MVLCRLLPRLSLLALLAVGTSGAFLAQAQAQTPRPGSQALAQAAEAMVAHRAVYDMRLDTSRPSSNVVGAQGTMSYLFTDSCNGWTVESRTDLSLSLAQGLSVQSSWAFLSWEQKDGESFRFRVRSERNGRLIENYEGDARIGATGAGTAVVRHSGGKEEVVHTLPSGTRFPTTHAMELLGTALEGRRLHISPLFDGTSEGGAFSVTTAIGRELPQDQAADNALLESLSWPMTLAFFKQDQGEDMPDFEVRLRYHLNGVAQDLIQDFGDFTLKGSLKELEALPAPEC